MPDYVTYPKFNFDWTAARQQAYDELTPYYSQKLNLAKGDVELAKKYIQEDYDRGLRYASEDYGQSSAEETIKSGQETLSAQGEANKRGVLVGQIPTGQETSKAPTSEYYSKFIGAPMEQGQQLRQQAIKRALSRQTEAAGISKVRGSDEQDRKWRDTQLDIEQEKREKANTQMAPLKYQEAYSKYRASNDLG